MKKLVLLLLVSALTFMLACSKETQETPSSGQVPAYEGQAPAQGEAAPSYGKTDAGIEGGRNLFRDTALGNGTAGKSCDSCHPEGRGLEAAGSKTSFHIMGQQQESLEEAVNVCIEMALKGTPIDPDSQEMKDITAYIRSLGI